MAATPKMVLALAAPTPPEEIGTLKGRANSKTGKTSPDMSYITARFVFDRLDSAVGPQNWQSRFTLIGDSLYAIISVFVEGPDFGHWVEKSDVGTESNIEAEKGNASDAIKRAGVQWGIGRDLYPSPNKKTAKAKPAQSAKSKPERDVSEDVTQTVKDADPEKDVVGQTGLVRKERAQMFASLREAGVPDSERKALVHTICGKWSTKDMDTADLELVLAFTDGGEYEPSDKE